MADVIADPTLPHTDEHPCPNCKARNAVFFQAQSRRGEVVRLKFYRILAFYSLCFLIRDSLTGGNEAVLCLLRHQLWSSLDRITTLLSNFKNLPRILFSIPWFSLEVLRVVF